MKKLSDQFMELLDHDSNCPYVMKNHDCACWIRIYVPSLIKIVEERDKNIIEDDWNGCICKDKNCVVVRTVNKERENIRKRMEETL